ILSKKAGHWPTFFDSLKGKPIKGFPFFVSFYFRRNPSKLLIRTNKSNFGQRVYGIIFLYNGKGSSRVVWLIPLRQGVS
ncbi:hypothetical protein, partial [Desulforamulus ruminis]|uniref:hypothetical protein n=1 Tax=Desulforamulus ruminis TaxID=1564 RepID=UPI002355C384